MLGSQQSGAFAESEWLYIQNQYKQHPDCDVMDFFFALKESLNETHCLECGKPDPKCQCWNDE